MIVLKRVKNSDYASKINTEISKGNSYYPYSKTFLTCGINETNGSYRVKFDSEEEQDKLEKELGYDKGMFNKTSKFWIDFTIPISDGRLNLFPEENYLDMLKLKVLQSMTIVGNSLSEVKENPRIEYVLFNEDQEISIRNKKRDIQDKAVILSLKMSEKDRDDYLYLKGIKPETLSASKKENLVLNDRDTDPSKFISVIQDKDLSIRVMISKFLNCGIIKKVNSNFVYNDNSIAYTIDDLVLYIKNIDNQAIIGMMKKEYAEKK